MKRISNKSYGSLPFLFLFIYFLLLPKRQTRFIDTSSQDKIPHVRSLHLNFKNYYMSGKTLQI